MSQPDLGQEYRLAMLEECMESGAAFSVIFAAEQEGIEAPVLTLLEPACAFGGSILEVLVRRGVCTQAEVDDVLRDRSQDGSPLYVPFALTWPVLRFMLVGTDNLHIVEMLDAVIDGGQRLPAVIAAGNSITATGYDPDTIRKPRPADVERARRKLRGRRPGK